MPVSITLTSTPTDALIRRETYVLRVYSVHGRDYPDDADHEFTDAKCPLIAETLLVLKEVEDEYDGFLEYDSFDELREKFSEDSIELAYTLIGGDITTDSERMAAMTAFEVTWYDAQGIEYETDLEFS